MHHRHRHCQCLYHLHAIPYEFRKEMLVITFHRVLWVNFCFLLTNCRMALVFGEELVLLTVHVAMSMS